MTHARRSVSSTLVAAVVVTGAILAGSAGSEAADARLEAESMSLASNLGTVYSDASASGGKALLIWTNGTATAQPTVPKTTRIVVRARGDQCYGAPKMTVKVDGSGVYTTAVKATSWADHAKDVTIAAGTHKVQISFTNDYRTKTCDRNLRVDRLTFVAPAAALYVEPNSAAKKQADEWRSTRPADAAQIDKIASQAQAFWFGSWSGDVRAATDQLTGAAAAAGKVPVLVAYNIPNRDCGGYSGGGASSADAYRSWIRSFADGIGSRQAIVVVEPDAVALADCLSSTDRTARYDLLKDAVSVLEGHAGVSAYIDAGHSRWLSPSEAASRLQSAGIAQAAGFSLNVSNYGRTADEVAYGKQVSSAASGKPFVVDTSRNGLGPDPSGEWCNPPGRALGDRPTLSTGNTVVDAYLWVKRPGESDGTCNGGPAAGQWWADYALGLAQRAAY